MRPSGPWAGEDARDIGLGGRKLWLPQLDSGGQGVWLEGVTWEGQNWGQNQSSYGFYLGVSKRGGWGGAAGGREQGTKEEVGGGKEGRPGLAPC